MRLWHQKLIPYLPRQQLLGQHREIAALRGKGWGKKHATVDYVFTHTKEHLYLYHLLVMAEMTNRGYNVDMKWHCINYRGKILGYEEIVRGYVSCFNPIYPEHNDEYLRECLDNLASKGIIIDMKEVKE